MTCVLDGDPQVVPPDEIHRRRNLLPALYGSRVQRNTALATRNRASRLDVAALASREPGFEILPLHGARLLDAPKGLVLVC